MLKKCDKLPKITKTIPCFETAVLCFILMFCLSCSNSVDFYILDDGEHQLQDYRGKWLILNFWAEWCAPCREEIPELNKLHAMAKQENLVIIGISYDPLTNADIRRIVVEWDIQYPVMATEPMPILPFKLPNRLPGNYILNPKGELVAQLSGTQNFKSLTNLLKTLRKKSNQSQ